MTNEELKSALAYGINLCELTKTTQVHISLNAAVEILAALDNQAPYQEDKIPDHGDYCFATLHKDAIELLKAQEPVEPDVDVDTWICGKCGHKLEHQEMLGTNVLFHEQYSYCPNCGKAVKWE